MTNAMEAIRVAVNGGVIAFAVEHCGEIDIGDGPVGAPRGPFNCGVLVGALER